LASLFSNLIDVITLHNITSDAQAPTYLYIIYI